MYQSNTIEKAVQKYIILDSQYLATLFVMKYTVQCLKKSCSCSSTSEAAWLDVKWKLLSSIKPHFDCKHFQE